MYWVATKSKDPHTKVGCIIVKNNRVVSTGYNGIPKMVLDNISSRSERPEKYKWYEHSERNAIYDAADRGCSTHGCDLYVNFMPCIDCARGIIQSGIKRIIIHKLYDDMVINALKEKSDYSQWQGHNDISLTMFKESGVIVDVFEEPVEMIAYFNGKKYVV